VWWQAHIFVIAGVMFAAGIALFQLNAKYYPSWCPVSTTIATQSWMRDDGTQMESAIEGVLIDGGDGPETSYRLSIYEKSEGKCILRLVVGEYATFLGSHGAGYWFILEGGMFSTHNGVELLCYDRRSGVELYREWGAKIKPVSRELSGVGWIQVEWNGVEAWLDLQAIPPKLMRHTLNTPFSSEN
jgi:hypothetical protein